MSRHSLSYLADNVLVGFADNRGAAWWAINGTSSTDSAGRPNHFSGAVPIDRVMELFGWDAVSTPIYVETPLGMMPVEGRQAVMRSDNGHVMGIFKDGYVIHQFRESLVKNVSDIIDSDMGLYLGSAGLLSDGAQAWTSIEVPDTITTPEGVAFRPYLLACTSHDGTLSTTYKRVVTNVVCDNTMAAGLAENGQQIKIRHSKYSKLKLTDARSALNIVHTIADDFAAEVAALCATTVTDRAWSMFLDAHAPIAESDGTPKTGKGYTLADNMRQTLTKLWNNDNRVSPWRNTAYGVLQAVNTYTHHEGIVRGKSREERNWQRTVEGGAEALDSATIRTLDKVLATIG